MAVLVKGQTSTGTGKPILTDANGALVLSSDSSLPSGAATDAAIAAIQTTYSEFETVAASQTDQMLGATGAAGDRLAGLLVIPATTSPGAVSIEYGATNISVFAGGAGSVTSLIPFFVPLMNIAAPSGGWEITTGADVSVIAFGNFT